MRFPIQLTRMQQYLILIPLGMLVFAGLVWSVYTYFPGGIDWINYRLSTLSALSFHSPYAYYFHCPPWTFIPLAPLAILPEKLGYAAMFWVGLIVTGIACHRLGAKPIAIAFVLLSYPVLYTGAYGNIEWLVYIGLLIPPRWGLFFVLVKPQSSIGIIIFWLIEAYREGGVKRVISVFAPVTICLILSFIVYGLWFQTSFVEIGRDFSSSLWPQSIPIGLALLVYSIRKRDKRFSLIASPFLAPYLAVNSWSASLVGLSSMQWETVVVSIAIWIVRFMSNKFLN